MYRTGKIIILLLICEAFQDSEEWHFPFWNIFFCFRDTDIFVLCKLSKWWCHEVCNQDGVWIFWSRVFQTWHQKCYQKWNKMTPVLLLPWQHFFRWSCLNSNWNSHHLLQSIYRWEFKMRIFGNFSLHIIM